MIAAFPTPDEDKPVLDQGETEDRLIPAPNASKIIDKAAVENAPAVTAAQETPDEFSSFVVNISG
jgi:hypothetical protein